MQIWPRSPEEEVQSPMCPSLLKTSAGMISIPTFEAIDWTKLRKEQLKRCIPSIMFIKLKYLLVKGDIDKIKALLVAGGHRQDRSLYSEE